MSIARETVGLCLAKGDEADAAIAHLLEHLPEIRVHDHVTYFRLEAERDICIDLDEVAAYLGRSLSMASFLVTLSAYFGQIEVDEHALRIRPVATGDAGGV